MCPSSRARPAQRSYLPGAGPQPPAWPQLGLQRIPFGKQHASITQLPGEHVRDGAMTLRAAGDPPRFGGFFLPRLFGLIA
jgi:hypothetical protein